MKIWEQFLENQQSELGADTVKKWLKPLKVVRFDARNLFLEANDSFQATWFEEHIRKKINDQLRNNNNQRIKVHLSIKNNPEKEKKSELKSRKLNASSSEFKLEFELLDPLCTFDHFIVEDSNLLTYKILSEVSNIGESGTTPFNPIYVYGVKGSGKSHLLIAATETLRSHGLSVVYAHAQTFTDHVVAAIRAGEMNAFRQAYRNSDILIIDDVHIFSRKSATQEEFFHTFNTMHIAGKPIILSANCPPAELQMVEPRLVSRFEWGIVLPLEILTKENMALVLDVRSRSIQFPIDDKVKNFLIESFRSVKSMVKALEVLALRSHLTLNKENPNSLSVMSAKLIIQDLLQEELKTAMTPQRITNVVAEYFGIRVEDILGKIQTRDCVLPRQIAMYLCRHQLKLPYAKIGEFFSKDHSTVMSSVKIIMKEFDTDNSEVVGACNSIIKRIGD